MPVTIPPASPILLLTRPEGDSRRLASDWAPRLPEAEIIISPLMEIVTTGPLPATTRYNGVVFTSANAVRASLSLGLLPDLPAFTVGRKTDDAARKAGFATTCAEGDANTLVSLIHQAAPSGRLIHLHGRHTTGDISARLTALGIPTDSAEVYDQREIPLNNQACTALSGTRPVIVPLFSPRTARLFAIGNNLAAPLYIGCMSDAVARELSGLDTRKCLIARHPDLSELTQTVQDLFRAAMSIEG